MTLLEQMALALRSCPCRCVYKRIGTVPVWKPPTGTERILEKQCSVCAALEAYEKHIKENPA